MTVAARLCADMGTLLEQEQEQLSALLSVLQAERDALTVRDTDTLSAVAGQKQAIMATLESSHTTRLKLMQLARMPAEEQSFEQILGLCEQTSGGLAELWQRTRSLLEACQQQNQGNGVLLESSRRATHEALSILLGHPAEPLNLYDIAGKTTASQFGGSRSVKA